MSILKSRLILRSLKPSHRGLAIASFFVLLVSFQNCGQISYVSPQASKSSSVTAVTDTTAPPAAGGGGNVSVFPDPTTTLADLPSAAETPVQSTNDNLQTPTLPRTADADKETAQQVTATPEPLQSNGQKATLSISTPAIPFDSALTVHVEGSPANSTEWVGLYSQQDSSLTGYLDWQYLNGRMTPPRTGLTNTTLEFDMPTTPGLYYFILFADDDDTVLAVSDYFYVGSN